MEFKAITAGAVLAGTMGIGGAAAQTIALATTQGGATEQIANAIAMVVTEDTPLQVRPQMSANTAQYMPLVNAGRVELGIANYPQTFYAIEGVGMSDQPHPDLRIIGTLFPFSAGLVVTEESGMTGYADLDGARVPRYPDDSLGDFIIRAGLAAGGLSYDDVTEVPTANFPAQYDNMRQGSIDVSIAAVGAQPTFDLEANLGGIRFLSFDAEAEDLVADLLPGTYLRTMPEDFHELPGMGADTVVFSYDYMFFAHKDVDDEIIDHVVRAMHAGQEKLQETGPLWSEYNPDDLGKAIGMPYHEAAIAAYRDLGAAGD